MMTRSDQPGVVLDASVEFQIADEVLEECREHCRPSLGYLAVINALPPAAEDNTVSLDYKTTLQVLRGVAITERFMRADNIKLYDEVQKLQQHDQLSIIRLLGHARRQKRINKLTKQIERNELKMMSLSSYWDKLDVCLEASLEIAGTASELTRQFGLE